MVILKFIPIISSCELFLFTCSLIKNAGTHEVKLRLNIPGFIYIDQVSFNINITSCTFVVLLLKYLLGLVDCTSEFPPRSGCGIFLCNYILTNIFES